MSTGGKRPSRVALQDALFGGVDVVELFSGNRRNVLHCATAAGASRQASALAQRDGAELVANGISLSTVTPAVAMGAFLFAVSSEP